MGMNRTLMMKLEQEGVTKADRPISNGGATLSKEGNGKSWTRTKVRMGGIQAIRAKKHKFVPKKK